QRKWNIFRILLQRLSRSCARFGRRLSFATTTTQIPQNSSPAFTNHFVSDLVNRGENTSDTAVRRLIRHRTIGNGEMCFFAEPCAVDLQFDVFDPGRRPALKRRVDQRLQDIPDLGPTLPDGTPQSPRMFASKKRTVRIVIN